MSFILDALKKSELERQRQSVPGLIEMPVSVRRRAVPIWVWVLAGLLCVNVGILFVLLLRSGSPGTAHAVTARAAPQAAQRSEPAAPAPASAQSTTTLPTAAGSVESGARSADHFSPMDNPPVYAPEIPVPEESAAATSAAPAAASAPSSARVGRRTEPVLNDEPPEDEAMLPTISELNLTGSQTLPDIHLDVHVYATRPSDRFVYINMRKYREGAVLQEGPTLERIRRDGVVLNYNGLRFLVPRQ